MNAETTCGTPPRPARLGPSLAAIYFALALVLFILTAVTTKPDNVGLDRIPFLGFTLPWSGISSQLALPGVFLNTAGLWLLGAEVQKLVLKIRPP